MTKTGIVIVGSRLASLYDDCLKMRIYLNKTAFKEFFLTINTLYDVLQLCSNVGINRLFVSVASGRDIKLSAKYGIEIVEEEDLWNNELYKYFIQCEYALEHSRYTYQLVSSSRELGSDQSLSTSSRGNNLRLRMY